MPSSIKYHVKTNIENVDFEKVASILSFYGLGTFNAELILS